MARKPGCGLVAILVIILVLFFGINEGVGYYYSNCDTDSDNFLSCLLEEAVEEADQEGTVTAVGTYTYKDYTVNVTAHIPLEGGAVTGTVTGTCEGQVRGSYNGQLNGVISGKMTGVCAPFFVNIPASAEYSGSVNKSGKTVPISFTGRGAGITHEGSMTLVYK